MDTVLSQWQDNPEIDLQQGRYKGNQDDFRASEIHELVYGTTTHTPPTNRRHRPYLVADDQ
jgi:hypothetical protein